MAFCSPAPIRANEKFPEIFNEIFIDKENFEYEARRLILLKFIGELGQDINETLKELCSKINCGDDEVVARCVVLLESLSKRGLKFQIAAIHLDLDCEAYLVLIDSKALLSFYPDLKDLELERFELLNIGEMPCHFELATSPNSKVLSFAEHRVRVERSKIDVVENRSILYRRRSHSSMESDNLRVAVLSLILDNGMSVSAALTNLCNPLSSSQVGEYIVVGLKTNLEIIGLRFEIGQDRGELCLAWPSRLLHQYPQLDYLHPLAWPGLRIGHL